jgi:hypothetical protein
MDGLIACIDTPHHVEQSCGLSDVLRQMQPTLESITRCARMSGAYRSTHKMSFTQNAEAWRTSVRDGSLGLVGAIFGVGVEVASIAVHHAAVPARLAPVADDAGAAAAVERVLVGARLQEELPAEAVDAGAAICGRAVGGCAVNSCGTGRELLH